MQKQYKTKELLERLQLSWFHIKLLIKQKQIIKIKKGLYELNENDFKEFNADAFRQQCALSRASKQSKSLHKYMENRTEEQKLEFSKTMSKASTKMWKEADDTFKELHRQRCIDAQARLEVKYAVSTGLKKRFATKDSKNKLRQRNIRSWNNPIQRQNRINGIHKAYSERHDEILAKSNETKRRNGTMNSSKLADACKQMLRDRGFTLIEEKTYPASEVKCDVYVVELDLWIEFHYHWAHGYMPYIKNSSDCQKQLLLWKQKAKTSKTYAKAIINWTKLDTFKKKLAKNNNLNWQAFYSKKSFEQWFNCKFLLENNS